MNKGCNIHTVHRKFMNTKTKNCQVQLEEGRISPNTSLLCHRLLTTKKRSYSTVNKITLLEIGTHLIVIHQEM